MPSRRMRWVNYLFLILLALIGTVVFPALRYTVLPILLAVAVVDVVISLGAETRRRIRSATRRTPRTVPSQASKFRSGSDDGARPRRPRWDQATDRHHSGQIVRCDQDCGVTAGLRCEDCDRANPYANALCGLELSEERLRERLN